jgi:hypothetical protein
MGTDGCRFFPAKHLIQKGRRGSMMLVLLNQSGHQNGTVEDSPSRQCGQISRMRASRWSSTALNMSYPGGSLPVCTSRCPSRTQTLPWRLGNNDSPRFVDSDVHTISSGRYQ